MTFADCLRENRKVLIKNIVRVSDDEEVKKNFIEMILFYEQGTVKKYLYKS